MCDHAALPLPAVTPMRGARTDIINSHAELRAALDLLVRAAEHTDAADSHDVR
jgi:hypothetical protein